MGEMDGWWNAYAAYDASGGSRGTQNSPRSYVAAWRRVVLILRGGPVASIDRRLARLGLPPIRARLPRAARGRGVALAPAEDRVPVGPTGRREP